MNVTKTNGSGLDGVFAQRSIGSGSACGDRRRVGLIAAHGWVGISTPVVMTARYLARAGFQVDLFIEADESCRKLGIAIPQFSEPGIRILVFPQQIGAPALPAIPGASRRDLSFAELVGRLPGAYDWLVGFDPHGLIRAGLLSETWGVPFLYHSLEIHDAEDDLKRLERRFSQRALMTVTQDEIRADILAAVNRIPRERIAVVYNSSLGDAAPEKHPYFREKFAIPPEKTIVLAVGTLLPHHCIDRIVVTVPSWPPEFVLVLHGWIPAPDFAKALQHLCGGSSERMKLSTDVLPAEHKMQVFQSADIGLVFYSPDDTNLTYACGSAGKIFDFMQAGVPIIANDLPGMRRLIEENGCGRVVERAEDIERVLPSIMTDYAKLSAGALESFGRYGFAPSFEALLNKIGFGLTAETQGSCPKREAVSTRRASGLSDADREEVRSLLPDAAGNEARWQSLYQLGRAICQKQLAGNFIVCGPTAGSAAKLLAELAKRYSRTPRKIFVCHAAPRWTAAGHPPLPHPRGPALERLKAAGAAASAAAQVVVMPSAVHEWLPAHRRWLGMVALLYSGGGYEGVAGLLEALAEQMVDGAGLQLEGEGGLESSRRALHGFEVGHGLTFDLEPVDAGGVRFDYPTRLKIDPACSTRMAEEFQTDDPVCNGIESQMSINERFQLYHAVRGLPASPGRLLRFIEIGSFAGASFYLVCKALQRLPVAFQGIAVEPCGRPQLQDVLQTFPDNAVHLPFYSHDAAGRLLRMLGQAQRPDFILVDGDHSYEGVRRDIQDFFPLLSPGGIMMFHDYLPPLDERNRDFICAHHAGREPGIRRACHEMMEDTFGLTPFNLPLLYPEDLSQTQAHLPIIPGVQSTIRAYRKPLQCR